MDNSWRRDRRRVKTQARLKKFINDSRDTEKNLLTGRELSNNTDNAIYENTYKERSLLTGRELRNNSDGPTYEDNNEDVNGSYCSKSTNGSTNNHYNKDISERT